MSMKRLALMAALSSDSRHHEQAANLTDTSAGARNSGSAEHANVNVLLSGVMLTCLILIVFLICYCCHKNMHKPSTRSQDYWQDQSQVYTLEGQCYEVAGLFVTPDSRTSLDSLPTPRSPSAPPAYDTVVSLEEKKPGYGEEKEETEKLDPIKAAEEDQTRLQDDTGLPSYAAAIRLESQGYV